MDNLLARVVGIDDLLMTCIPRVAGFEGQYSKMNQRLNVLESKHDRETQRRRLDDDPDNVSAAGAQPQQSGTAARGSTDRTDTSGDGGAASGSSASEQAWVFSGSNITYRQRDHHESHISAEY